MSVAVVGSINLDLVFTVAHYVAPGKRFSPTA